jgi:hypothetical protein
MYCERQFLVAEIMIQPEMTCDSRVFAGVETRCGQMGSHDRKYLGIPTLECADFGQIDSPE